MERGFNQPTKRDDVLEFDGHSTTGGTTTEVLLRILTAVPEQKDFGVMFAQYNGDVCHDFSKNN